MSIGTHRVQVAVDGGGFEQAGRFDRFQDRVPAGVLGDQSAEVGVLVPWLSRWLMGVAVSRVPPSTWRSRRTPPHSRSPPKPSSVRTAAPEVPD